MLAYQYSVAEVHEVADNFADLASKVSAVEGYGVLQPHGHQLSGRFLKEMRPDWRRNTFDC